MSGTDSLGPLTSASASAASTLPALPAAGAVRWRTGRSVRGTGKALGAAGRHRALGTSPRRSFPRSRAAPASAALILELRHYAAALIQLVDARHHHCVARRQAGGDL